jgi:Nucleoside-diphosphate-sugar pyrophosphorylase involved in lipopolysaccharide biosynthesis/translation initiation factor 2B, gamma/epsilon subunits (eIF-2Bgamma/eIF-2Bepsilon)
VEYVHYNPSSEYLAPLTQTRHSSHVEVGGSTLFEHAERSLEGKHCVFVHKHLNRMSHENAELHELDGGVVKSVDRGDILYNPVVVPDTELKREIRSLGAGECLHKDGMFVAGCAKRELTHGNLERCVEDMKSTRTDKDAAMLKYPWDIVRSNGNLIERTFDSEYRETPKNLPESSNIQGQERIYIHNDAEVEPGVKLDASKGSIVVEKNAAIYRGTEVEGPAYIGEGTKLSDAKKAKVHGDTHIGMHCRIGGEVGETVIHSFTNKYHAGHLANSVVGSWVNFGAGTANSDLKNTYGTVRFQLPCNGEEVEAGQFFGAAVGDQVRFGINTSIYTGKAVGPIASVTGRVSENVRPFAWHGESKEEYDVEKQRCTRTE